MTPMTQNIVVLLFVAAAAVYAVVRLRRVAAGQTKCVCGSKTCGSAAAPRRPHQGRAGCRGSKRHQRQLADSPFLVQPRRLRLWEELTYWSWH